MAVDLSDKISYKRLVTAGNNEIWYEDLDVAAGTMTELDTSGGAIDTSDQLDMFEAYQKAFVINGSNLKVADFINTKLTVAAMTSPPAHGDILTQDQTGGDYAYMVVDFVNTAKTLIYGYAYYGGSATAFLTTKDISSNNATATMDPNPIPLADVTTVTAAPHWYNWTDYPNIILSIDAFGQASGATKTFGSLPNKAYIGCLYRGRNIISGDPEHPFQWYMSRQAYPWDFAYIANDAGTPVKGGNSDAGELGDIVKALISYKDDYLIFGCANSIWFLAGDPAEGGSINELSLTAGILGAKAWTWDKQENLYILGTNGILKIPPGFGPPENKTELSYPDFIKDLDFDPALHRVTMEYDRQRHGLVIAKTTLADGTHTGWWYDLRSEGLFPETYPEECGPYSLFYYDSNDPDYRGLLVGCKDGYIRVFDETEEDDDIGGSDEAIDSHVTFGPLALASENKEGMIHNIATELVGGGSGGTVEDSDDVTYKIFAGRSADDVEEKMVANTSPRVSGTFSAPGRPRGGIKKQKIKDIYAGIRIGNATATKTWGLEKLIINSKEKGRVK